MCLVTGYYHSVKLEQMAQEMDGTFSLISRHEVLRLVRLKSLFRLRGRGMGYLELEDEVLGS